MLGGIHSGLHLSRKTSTAEKGGYELEEINLRARALTTVLCYRVRSRSGRRV